MEIETQTKLLGVGSRVKHSSYGEGVVIRLHGASYEVCFMTYGIKHVGKEYENWEILDAVEAEEEVTFTAAEKSLTKILKAWSGMSGTVDLGDRWKDGVMILKPADPSLKSKEIPIDAFFHKIVMVRDRLRVMEQRINSSKLPDEGKVNLQQYITRIYGSLTTFNAFFKYKEDHFVGEKSR